MKIGESLETRANDANRWGTVALVSGRLLKKLTKGVKKDTVTVTDKQLRYVEDVIPLFDRLLYGAGDSVPPMGVAHPSGKLASIDNMYKQALKTSCKPGTPKRKLYTREKLEKLLEKYKTTLKTVLDTKSISESQVKLLQGCSSFLLRLDHYLQEAYMSDA